MDYLCTHMCGHLIIKALEKDFSKNVVVSPLSFNAVLNMIAAGATGNTLNQMLWFFGCDNVNDLKSRFITTMNVACNNNNNGGNGMDCGGDGPDVSFVNGVWVDKRFRLTDNYQMFVKSFCKGEARNVNFKNQANEVVKEANLWAKNETRGLVTNVLNPDDITPYTICLLGNALYFKGAWNESFKREFTRKMDFHLLNGEKVFVPFMTGCEDYLYGSFDGLQIVSIPYRTGGGGGDNRRFAMYIFLPNENNGLPDLLQKANSNPTFFNQDFKLWSQRLDKFWIPKFKFSYKIDQVLETLKQMGLTLPFSEDCQELTEMVDINSKDPFYISRIVQKAIIEVDEEGTEAAAVTFAYGGFGGSCLVRPPEVNFVADHPFMFMIREENAGIVLFTGAVLNPSSG